MADIARTFYAATQTDHPGQLDFPPDKQFESEQYYSLYRAYNHPIYGRVQLYRENSTSRLIMAVTSLMTDKNEAAEVLACLRIRQNLNHRNLLYMLDYSNKSKKGLCSSDFNVAAFFEFPLTNLAKDVKERQTKSEYYTPDELNRLVSQMLDVLVHLNDKGLYHGNICPKTIQHRRATKTFILLDHFGEKRSVEKFHREQLILADEIFLSPEMYGTIADDYYHVNEQKEIDLAKNDIFSLGMVVLHLGLLKNTQDVYASDGDMNREKLAAHIKMFEDRYAERNPPLIHALKLMLAIKPADRPTSYELRSSFKIGLAAIGNVFSFSGSKEKSNSMVLEDLNPKDKRNGELKTDVTNFLNVSNKNDSPIKQAPNRVLNQTPDMQRQTKGNSVIETENDDFFVPTEPNQYRSRQNFFDMPESRHQIVKVQQATIIRRDSKAHLPIQSQSQFVPQRNTSNRLVNVPSIQLLSRDTRHFDTAPRILVQSVSQTHHPTQMSMDKNLMRNQALLTDQTLTSSTLLQNSQPVQNHQMSRPVFQPPNPALYHSIQKLRQINPPMNPPQVVHPFLRHGSIATIEQPKRSFINSNEDINVQNHPQRVIYPNLEQQPKRYEPNNFAYSKPKVMIYQPNPPSRGIFNDKPKSIPVNTMDRDNYLNIYDRPANQNSDVLHTQTTHQTEHEPIQRRPTKGGRSTKYVLDAPQSNWKTDVSFVQHDTHARNPPTDSQPKQEAIRNKRPPISSSRLTPTPMNFSIGFEPNGSRMTNGQPRLVIPQQVRDQQKTLMSKFKNQSTRQFYTSTPVLTNEVRKSSFA
ncbi:MAG: hypothetical protein IM572_06660 [Chitinophagaceae bacterium]|nr:hypothetical protein [Chitinophagaceae bacterium]